MSHFTLLLLSFSMSVDAFAIALCRGAAARKPSMTTICHTALIFGIVETLTPLLGWLIGHSTHSFIADYDHWIAFIALLILGTLMLREYFSHQNHPCPAPCATTCGMVNQDKPCTSQSFTALIMAAVATSIDSMVIGVSLAFLDVNIGYMALSIGVATTLMVVLGKILGKTIGRYAELLGGLVLIGIGTSILLEHLNLFA